MIIIIIIIIIPLIIIIIILIEGLEGNPSERLMSETSDSETANEVTIPH